jgi:integrase
MAWIRTYKGKKGTAYTAVVRLPGRPSLTKTFRRRTDAVKWSHGAESAIREGRLRPDEARRRVTLADLVRDYESAVLSSREGVDARQRRAHLRWWVQQLGACRVTEVTAAAIAECRDRLRRGEGPSGQPAAPATQVRYLATLSHLFSYAVRERELLAENPVRRVRRPAEPQGRLVSLTAEQRARLLAACKASGDDRLHTLTVLALSTAARQSELTGLRWADIDLARRIAVLNQTKNKERRSLPLASLALDLLRERRRVRRLGTDLVFADERGRATFPRKPWEAARAAAGLPDLRFHDLRHAALSEMAMCGATLSELATIAGHKGLAMVRRYQHLSEAHVSGVVERMNAKLFA